MIKTKKLFRSSFYHIFSTLIITTFLFGLLPAPVLAEPEQPHHFDFDMIDNQEVGTPFTITITAKDASDNTVTSYIGINLLSDDTGTISPTNTANFTNGVWTGDVTISQALQGNVITTSGDSAVGTSNGFDVTEAPAQVHHFDFSFIDNQAEGVPFTITITAKDSDNVTFTTYSGTNTLSDSTGTISPSQTGAFSQGIWSGNVTIDWSQYGIVISTTGDGKQGVSNSFDVTDYGFHIESTQGSFMLTAGGSPLQVDFDIISVAGFAGTDLSRRVSGRTPRSGPR